MNKTWETTDEQNEAILNLVELDINRYPFNREYNELSDKIKTKEFNRKLIITLEDLKKTTEEELKLVIKNEDHMSSNYFIENILELKMIILYCEYKLSLIRNMIKNFMSAHSSRYVM